MSVIHSPLIPLSGLAFTFDSNNIKSYRGPAMQNLANGISHNGISTGTGYSSTALTETIDIPQVGLSTVITNIIQNNYTSFSPTNNNCCPSLHAWGGISVTPSTLYTYLILYRCESGYTNPNYMYRYEFASNGGAYVTEGGVHSDSNRVHLGGGWFYAWGTFTTQSTTNWLGHCGTFYYRYSNLPDKLSVARVLIVAGNYSGLHPRFWPAQATTRNNTQAIVDLTGQNTITATSLTYASDGSFSFNGSSNSLTIPNTTLGNGNIPWTVNAWVRTNTTVNSLGLGSVLSNSSGGPVYSMLGVNSGRIVYWTYQNNAWAQKLGVRTVNDNNWHMLTWVNYNNNTMDMYVDGILDANVADSTSGNNNPVDRIGSSWAGFFSGSIAYVARYTRALTANEVRQSFIGQRGEFGL